MAFTLMYCCGQKVQRITDPCFEDIVWAVKDLVPAINHFAILDEPEHTEGNIYIQTRMVTSDDDTELGYILETRFCPANNSTGQDFAHYQLFTEDEAVVMHHLKRYFMGETTDVTGWMDITEDLKNGKG